ncbi:glycerol-3-phosphate acyltransferase, chloroplastic-like [Pistacia vera]|uniref:glycerol-3-phosphate acyltransferase, chloroplastic n=1 Tax=Pistacia vera TaxID=55513 RepID=UPI001263E48D|nr:glycerol-3-phosphate acyltransferase, chloroplastic [Pistacia vera]XP_031261513.1 glycerol-3-phosphate acyltransferase, chloroplastic-like [Pistacia vera]
MSSLSLTFLIASPRVSSVPLSSSFSSSLNLNLSPPSSLSFRSGARRFASFKVQAMSKMLQDVESAQKTIVATSSAQDEDKKSSSISEVNHSRTFLDVRTEQELLSGISKEAEAGRLSSNLAALMEELYHNYKNAVFSSGKPGADELVLSNMAVLFDRVLLDMEEPFEFPPYHKALREPFDYYIFGQNYIRPLIDFSNSYVGNISLFYEMEQKLQQGHNIVLISNHQSEADPAVIALLLESANTRIAENLIYVAGDRVLTDPLCKPFSMGRNLICVYSKKHMLDAPELIEMKRKANTRSLKEMALLLRGGSQIVWIAPSGGRDRPDPVTEEWHPAPFDASAVDNMRRLAEHSGAPGHIYPLALLCYDVMPPPRQVEKEIGERRVVSFSGVGLSVAPEISFSDIASAFENPEEAREAYTQALYDSVNEQYNVLKSAIHGKQGLQASIPSVSLSQPGN